MTSTIRIEKDVPFPTKYPFQHMEVGDSFFAPASPDVSAKIVASRIRASSFNYRKINKDAQFSTRIIDHGCRCWRVA